MTFASTIIKSEVCPSPILRWLGRVDYQNIWEQMKEFTANRDVTTPDEIWFLEHPPVYTLGLNGQPSHILNAAEIPVIKVDRGGQVTYHGPGQLVVYPLLDLRRWNLNVRELVMLLEQAVIAMSHHFSIAAEARRDAPGVYVGASKLASVGLRIRRGCSYHGLAINVALDSSPFERINPCGYAGLKIVQLSDLGGPIDVQQTAHLLAPELIKLLNLQFTKQT